MTQEFIYPGLRDGGSIVAQEGTEGSDTEEAGEETEEEEESESEA